MLSFFFADYYVNIDLRYQCVCCSKSVFCKIIILVFMGRRRVKKTVKQASTLPGSDLNGVEVKEHDEKQKAQFTDPDGIIYFL